MIWESFLNNWVNEVEKGMKLSVEDKAKITGEGAEAFSTVLHDPHATK